MRKVSSLVWLARFQVLLSVVLAGLCAYHVYATGLMNNQQRLIGIFEQNQRSFSLLAGATAEYARTNAAFGQALIKAGWKSPVGSAAADSTPSTSHGAGH
jgi:hypothetical protein